MDSPQLHFIDCPDASGTHAMAYWAWGDATASHTVVCVHGLTRQGRDFDALAQALLARAPGPLRVICPDVAGRGRSAWLADPQGYQIPQYASDLLTLLRHLQPKTLDWVGTSMGGLIGLALSQHASAAACAIRRLVLNDVGPVLEWQSLQRIGTYVGVQMRFDSEAQAVAALAAISLGFGPHTPQQWLALSRPMLRTQPDGSVSLHYDPAIAQAFRAITPEAAVQGEAALWALYDALTCPTLLLRGAHSDLLSVATAQAMTQRGPRAQLREFDGVGHAPTLVVPEQTDAVCSFLFP